jgi:hypothetical protein
MSDPLTEREQDILLYAWELGRAYERDLIASVADDINRILPKPARTHYQRVAERIELFGRCAERLHERVGTRMWLGTDNGAAVTPW